VSILLLGFYKRQGMDMPNAVLQIGTGATGSEKLKKNARKRRTQVTAIILNRLGMLIKLV